MNRKSIAWILKFTSELPNTEEKIKCLQENAHPSILLILKYCFDPNIKWLLPEGEPPYKKANDQNIDFMFYHEARKLYLFVEGGNPNLLPHKREILFIRMLESLCEDDAQLLISIKDKKLPYKGLTKRIVKKAFPELF